MSCNGPCATAVGNQEEEELIESSAEANVLNVCFAAEYGTARGVGPPLDIARERAAAQQSTGTIEVTEGRGGGGDLLISPAASEYDDIFDI